MYQVKTNKWLQKGWRNLKQLDNPADLTIEDNRHSGHKKIISAANCGIGIEIGVREAFFSTFLIKETSLDFLHGIDILNCKNAEKLEELIPYRYKFTVGNSLKIDKQFPNEWFDFIHLDSNHHYNHVKNELELWWPKLRPLGIMSGDDFCNFYCHQEGIYGVVDAVLEFVKLYNLDLYLIGTPKLSLSEYYNLAELNGRELKNYRGKKPNRFQEVLNWYIQKPITS